MQSPMRPADLLAHYQGDSRTANLTRALTPDAAKVELKGAAASATPLIAAAQFATSGGSHLFVLDDKESAAYFLNDLEQLLGKDVPLFFPRSARVPYQEEVTENANIAMRAEVLNEIRVRGTGLVVVSFPEALSERVISRKELTDQTFTIALREVYTMDFLDDVFITYGFHKVDFVYEPGQYAIRGGIVDIFSFSFDYPYRIEFFGDEVESIRKFDPVNQLSINKMTRAVIVPNIGNSTLHDSVEPFFHFLPDDAVIWATDVERMRTGLQVAFDRAEQAFSRTSGQIKFTPPEELFIAPADLDGLLAPFRVVEFDGGTSFPERTVCPYDIQPQPSFNKNFDLIGANLRANAKQEIGRAHV